MRLNPQIVGNLGLYWCCYKLSLLGWNAMPTARNARGVDIIAYSSDASRFKGIQVKDRSLARVERCLFKDNGITVEANRKKWLFGSGGQIVLKECEFKTTPRFVKDARSTISILEDGALREPPTQPSEPPKS